MYSLQIRFLTKRNHEITKRTSPFEYAWKFNRIMPVLKSEIRKVTVT